MNKIILILVVAALAGIGGYFILQGSDRQSSEENITAVDKEFVVEGKEYSFSPSSISINAGERVRITFKNTGGAVHNFVIQDLSLGTKTIGPGQTDILEFTAPLSGSYTFSCSVPGHAVSGMLGDLIVE